MLKLKLFVDSENDQIIKTSVAVETSVVVVAGVLHCVLVVAIACGIFFVSFYISLLCVCRG